MIPGLVRGRAFAAFAGATILATGCSILVDTNGLVGSGTDASAAGDAAGDADANANGNGDASAEGGGEGLDAGTADAGTADAAVMEAAAPFYGNALSIDMARNVSAPSSLLAKYAATVSTVASITKNLPTGQGVLVAFDVALDGPDLADGQIIVLQLNLPLTPSTQSHYFYVNTYGGQLRLSEQFQVNGGDPVYTATVLADPIPATTWSHIAFTLNGVSAVITASFNGTTVTPTPMQHGFPRDTFSVSIGNFADALKAPARGHLDNVVVDIE